MSDDISRTILPLNNGAGRVPALGFGTMIADPETTRQSVLTALRTGYRLLDCAAQYGNETQVGEALNECLSSGEVRREDVVVSTKLWNTGHRPGLVKPAFEASRRRLGVEKIDLYLIHSPFAFLPRDAAPSGFCDGSASYDLEVGLLETWQALECLVDEGLCGAIGLANFGLDKIGPLYDAARIKPAVVQVEAHPYLPQDPMLAFCRERRIVTQASCPFGHGLEPRLLNDSVVYGVAQQAGKTTAQVLLSWALQRGTAPLPMSTSADHIRENFELSPLSPEALSHINMGITSRHRFDTVVTDGVQSFDPKE